MMRKIIAAVAIICLLSFVFYVTLAQTSTSSSETASPQSETKTTTISTTVTTVDNGDDAKIIDMIYKKYAKDSALNGTALTVTCSNGVVEISGTVTMTSQEQEAVAAAKSIEGVKLVKSSITVKTNKTQSNQPTTPNY